MNDLSLYQSNYLFLLVGGNPLPVYVSALQLATKNTQIKLLHSTSKNGSRHTKTLADHLEESLEKLGYSVEQIGISSVDGQDIRRCVRTAVEGFNSGVTVGINYTGGTKQMAVHVLDMLKKKYGTRLVQSYLSAQDKRLYISKGSEYVNYPVQTGNKITLETLLSLHGYKQVEPLKKDSQPNILTDALLKVHQTKDGIEEWYNWRGNEYRNEETLPNLSKYPNLEPVIQAMEQVCDGKATPEKVAHYLNYDQLKSCANWFKGQWFEEWILQQVSAVSKKLPLHNVGANLKICLEKNKDDKRLEAEIDIVVMKGYQLFVISAIASAKSGGETKKHLFEAYTRAKQLGGDEARVALVYLGENPQSLQEKINRDWLVSDAIVVFGRNQLQNFQNELYHWFKRNG